MLILAVDTTTRSGSIAVTADERVLALVPGDATRTHGERLPAEIATTLDRAGVSLTQIDLLAVATGPGGFTGIRIGLAAIQGLAMAVNKPVAGVSALDALAEQIDASDETVIVPWMDAQRGDVFTTLIDARSRTTIEAAVAERPSVVLERWRPHFAGRHVVFIGDAVARDQALLDLAGNQQWRVQRPEALAPHIARLARRLSQQGKAGPPHALVPTYVRRPDAEIDREKRRPKADAERNSAGNRGGIGSKG